MNPLVEIDPSDMDVYCTDDYPREGCIVSIDVQKNGYGLRIAAPNGAFMECYALVKTPKAIGRMVAEWCAGRSPRLHDPSDPGSSVT